MKQMSIEKTKTYWVYGHYTDDGILFYIGAGILSRFFTLKCRNKKHKFIRENFGWSPGVLAGPFQTRDEMFQAEIFYIAKYHTHTRDPQANIFASNLSSGGKAPSKGARWTLTQEQKENLLRILRSDKHRIKLSIATKLGIKTRIILPKIENYQKKQKKKFL